MNTRITSRALATLGMVAALAGAASCSPAAVESSGPVKLTVWSWRTEDVAAYNEIFDAYEKKHNGVTIEFKAFKNTEYNTILSTGLTKSGGPDVAMLRSYGGLQPVIEAGALLPLDDEVDLSEFAKPVLDASRGKKDGKVYGVPAALQTIQVFYNKKIFADAGVAVPTTWAQLTAAMATLKAKGVVPLATTAKDTWMLPIVHEAFGAARYGGTDFQQRLLSGQTTLLDPAYVDSIAVLKQLQPFMPKNVAGVAYTDAQILFMTGKAAMFPGGSFELGFFTAQNPDLELGVFSAPPPPGAVSSQPLTPGFADASFGVAKQTKQRKEALELVRWMATKDFGQRYTDKLKQISPVPGVAPSDPLLAEMRQRYETAGSPYIMLVDFRYGQPTGTDLLGEGLQKMLLGSAQPAQVAASVQKGLSQWFKPTGG